MKKILILYLIGLLVPLSFSQSAVTMDWRWRNDDGDAFSATWKDSILSPVLINNTENIRLRIELINSYDIDTITVALFYSTDPFAYDGYSNNGWWVEINKSDTGVFCLSNSQYLSDTSTILNNKTLPGRYDYFQYQKTICVDSTQELFLDLDQRKTIELEYCIKPTSKLKAGTTYFFKLGTLQYPFGSIAAKPKKNNIPVLITPPINWSFKPTGLTSHFNSISHSNNNSLYISGFDEYLYRGYILKSTDNGSNWIIQRSDSAYDIRSISFYNNYVWAMTNKDTYNGQILKSTDGGETWQFCSKLYDLPEMYWIKFFNENEGVALGDSWSGLETIFYKTTDGGSNWQSSIIEDYFRASTGYFYDFNTGWFAGSHGDVFKTTDGGITWINQTDIHPYPDFNAVFFVNENVGWAAGGSYRTEVIIKTKDGGDHWTPQVYGEADQELTNIFFIDEQTGWAIGSSGKILKTTDGGTNWIKQQSGTLSRLNQVYFTDPDNGWIVGENAVILKTTNGGTTFVLEEKNTESPDKFILSQNYPNPFNNSTVIIYSIPKEELVTIKIYNILGEEVAALVNETKAAGNYKVTFNSDNLTSGVYLYKLTSGGFTQTKKMILLK
jgi:photosystem II stability/assembly factor-like uncharacterized protein